MKKLTSESFKERAVAVHGDKYDYSKVNYTTSKVKVVIVCPDHGPFDQTPNNHLNGQECPACMGRGAGQNTLAAFKRKAKEVHGSLYGYSKVEYRDTRTKVTITCKKHGDFEQAPGNHLQGQGCSACKHESMFSFVGLTQEEFLSRSRAVHGDRYSYEEAVFVGRKTNVTLLCPSHGRFRQTPDVHFDGGGCPACGRVQSKGEALVESWLTRWSIPFEAESYVPPHVTGHKPSYFDFKLLDRKTYIEVDGEHHWKPVCFGGISEERAAANLKAVQYRDRCKDEWAVENGYRVVRIRTDENIEAVLEKQLTLI